MTGKSGGRIEGAVHGMVTAAVREPGREMQPEVPDGVDINHLVEMLKGVRIKERAEGVPHKQTKACCAHGGKHEEN